MTYSCTFSCYNCTIFIFADTSHATV